MKSGRGRQPSILKDPQTHQLEMLNQSFTFVTDWAATTPRIVGASVSDKNFPLSLKWAGCVFHQLDTCLCTNLNASLFPNIDDFSIRAIADVNSMNKVVEGVKRADLNHRLPLGCAVFQEVETRFHSFTMLPLALLILFHTFAS
jgi:hypothetical protein